MTVPLLRVEDLHVWFDLTGGGELHAVQGVGFELREGERLGLVGESGCGKTTAILALMGLLPASASVAGRVFLDGEDILFEGEDSVSPHRWKDIAMVFQGAMNAFNPVKRVGDQIAEPMKLHGIAEGRQARRQVGELLERVGIPAARAGSYPHEFSGGMRQRAAIAMALACKPRILLADEPTTALDVMVQAQILQLLVGLADDFGLALVLVTHDLPVVAQVCDARRGHVRGRDRRGGADGRAVPRPPSSVHAAALRRHARPVRRGCGRLHPGHAAATRPRARRLPVPAAVRPRLRALPDREAAHARDRRPATPRPATSTTRAAAGGVMSADGDARRSPRGRGPRHPLPGAARVRRRARPPPQARRPRRRRRHVLAARRARCSRSSASPGCGKTTTAQTILRLVDAESRDDPLPGRGHHQGLRRAGCARSAADAQMIFQDPYESLDPRFRVRDTVEEPLRRPRRGRRRSRRARAACRDALDAGGPDPAGAVPRALPARALRRPAPARRDRGEPRARPEAARRGRAGLDARRLGPRGHPHAAGRAPTERARASS